MKIVITGGAGQLGTELSRQLAAGGSALGPIPAALQNAQAVSVDLPDADLAKLCEVQALFEKHRPDVVINCAAYTNVDGCETNRDAAFAANAVAPRNLARMCEQTGAKLLHVSTDYVFPGDGSAPADETEATGPRSAYGKTKLLGEEYVRQFSSRYFILRTAWLYGVKGGNFVKTMLRLAKNNGGMGVVNDQLGNPTNAEDLAHHILQLAPTEEYGLYHCTGEGICSWYDFAAEIVRLSGIEATVSPLTTAEYTAKFPQSAKRPAYSALDNAMLRATVGDAMRPWQAALADYMENNTLEDLLS